MPPDSTTIQSILNDPAILITYFMAVIGAFAMIAKLVATVKPWFDAWYGSHSLSRRLGAELYTPAEIVRATRYYIRPKAQDIDPAHAADPGSEKAVKEDLCDVVDRLLARNSEFKYSVLLADSGMGKTSFLLYYYKRYLSRRKHFRLEIVPLGRKDADERIEAIDDKPGKVLFLDALDEDLLAIVDHKQRLRDLCEMSQEFLHVLITCRTQFFPKASEEPGRTGVLKIAPTVAGKGSDYVFHKRFLSPFDEAQVAAYLKQRYGFFLQKNHRKAQELVNKIPRLTMRPMLLSYIDELLKEERAYDYAFQLYEQMVAAWLIREEVKVEGIDKRGLLSFCKRLAFQLYANREEYAGERIPLEKIGPLTNEFGIDVEAWKLSGRSLLNRDAEDYYKFAHRSIMEYLFVQRFLELPADERRELRWTDQMKTFVIEMFKLSQSDSRRRSVDLSKADLSDPPEPLYSLRQAPSAKLSPDEVTEMIRHFDFFCASEAWANSSGKGVLHNYKLLKDDNVVYDAMTGLHWQQSGSPESLNYKGAREYVRKLKKQGFAGYSDWRLPTLEEAMSLMESSKLNGDLYVDPKFDATQQWIWTSDNHSASRAWLLGFYGGYCYDYHFGHNFNSCARAVR